MSDLFLKNSIRKNNFDNNATESSINISNILNFSNKTHLNYNRSTNNVNNNSVLSGGNVTSSANMSKINNYDVNNLFDMLTSEASNNTSTSNLEIKLKKLLTHKGGYSKNVEMSESTETIETKIKHILKNSKPELKQKGGFKPFIAMTTLALTGSYLSTLNPVIETDTEINIEQILTKPVNTLSTIDENNSTNNNEIFINNNNVLNETNNKVLNETDDIFIKSSTTNNSIQDSLSPTSSDNIAIKQSGGNNPALVAFRDLCKVVSKELDIPNGAKNKKISGHVQRDLKAAKSDITPENLVAEAKIFLKTNIKKYNEMKKEILTKKK